MSKLIEASLAAADLVSDLIGYAAVRDWTATSRRGERLLDLVSYTQLNSFACGAVAGFQVVKSIYSGAEFADFYEAIKPDPIRGTPASALIRGLRRFGVAVTPRRNLTTANLRRCIRGGNYVIVCIQNPGADHHHWVVAHGYARSHLLLAGNGVPWFHRRRIAWERFESIWRPYGNGLICCEEE